MDIFKVSAQLGFVLFGFLTAPNARTVVCRVYIEEEEEEEEGASPSTDQRLFGWTNSVSVRQLHYGIMV